MGLGSGSTVNKTWLGPPQFQVPYITQAFQEAKRLYESPGPTLYPGSWVAEFTPTQVGGQQMILEAARQAQEGIGPALLGAMGIGLRAPDVESNPFLGKVADAVTQRVNQALTEQWLPSIRSGAIATGTLGGSRQALAEGMMGREAARELSNALASLFASEYGRGMQTMLNTMAFAPQTMQALTLPGMVTAGVGEQQRALEQAKIDEAIQKWAFEQNLPYQKLAEYYNIISRPFGSTGESTVEARGSELAQGLGAGLGILGWLLEWLRGR